MDKNIICGCGHDRFWFFKEKVRCSQCLNEYRYDSLDNLMVRRFDGKKHRYSGWKVVEDTDS